VNDGSGRISVHDLTKQFGAVTAVAGLGFTVEPGGVTGFLGPNGSGKTTTLRMILGLVAPTSGEARINGARFAELDAPGRVVGAVLEAQGSIRRAAGGRTCGSRPPRWEWRTGGSTRCWAWSGSPTPEDARSADGRSA
jgi:energy-coupling factor transporter ATP-binding protein EcfA2